MSRARIERSVGVALAIGLLSACHSGGGAHLVTKSGENAAANIRTNDVESPDSSPGLSLGEFVIKTDACAGLELRPDYTTLGIDDFEAFLTRQGISFQRVRARDDLHYVDAKVDGEAVRFRVATLGGPRAAARDLYEALLQHGPGSWGIHRSNVAVLAPIGDSISDIVGFATRTKLACWGILTAAGRDDVFVVPGGYYEP